MCGYFSRDVITNKVISFYSNVRGYYTRVVNRKGAVIIDVFTVFTFSFLSDHKIEDSKKTCLVVT